VRSLNFAAAPLGVVTAYVLTTAAHRAAHGSLVVGYRAAFAVGIE
jgi:hypothetical protein